jgi:prepilin-type N-terminal cleavage/methylation domain-containing protein
MPDRGDHWPTDCSIRLTNMRLNISHAKSQGRQSGFTFVELVVGMAVLVTFAAVAFAAFTQLNRFATASRLRVHALALAQQQIDSVLTAQWRINAGRPDILVAGTRTESDLTLNTDAGNNPDDFDSDFTDLVTPVRGTRVTQITNVTARTLRATVTVTFNYANRAYTVSLTTMRATDTI